MIQAPGADTLLDEIVSTLITRFRPARVFLFGSRARNDARPDSDYDFLVEIDRTPPHVMVTRQGMTWLDAFPDIEIQVHIRKPGELELSMDDPGTIEWDVARDGILLYPTLATPSMAPVSRVRERGPRNAPSLKGWLARAKKDLRVARHLAGLPPEDWEEDIAYHAQQSAEKYLKAVIIAEGRRPRRTHELMELLEQARGLGFPFPGLDRACLTLSRYAVAGRYPSQHVVTATRARRALESADRIAQLALQYLK